MHLMRSLLLPFTTAMLPSPAARAQCQPGYDSIKPSTLKADLTFLSSDALEGRRSLERGSEVAIQWIASEFAKAGLKPAAGDSYLQPVPLIEFTSDRNLTTLTVVHNGKIDTFRGADAMPSAVPPANEVSGAGSIVFAGFGITAPELNYDDYAGIDAKGKIVLIFNHEPQEADSNSVFNGKGNTRYANNNYKLFNAQRHGAIALVTMADPGHQGPVRGAAPATNTGRGQQAAARPRIPTEALADGGPAIPLFTIGARAANYLFEIAGKKAADVRSAIDMKSAPASFGVSGHTNRVSDRDNRSPPR